MYDDETYEDIPYAPISTKRSMDVFFTGNWRTMRPVLDVEKCINCNICWKFCPDVAILLGEAHVTVNYDYCKGCGICAHECPVKAFNMIREVEAMRQGEAGRANGQGEAGRANGQGEAGRANGQGEAGRVNVQGDSVRNGEGSQ